MVNLKNLLDTVTEKATYEPDIGSIMEYVEEVKKLKGSKIKGVVNDLRKKLSDGNQYSVCLALEVTDFVMKNCAIDVRNEIMHKDFLAAMKAIVVESTNDRAVNRTLELLAEWKSAFGGESECYAVVEVCQELTSMGVFMPQVQISAASYLEKPPKWMEAQRCCQCRSEFGKIIGKGRHHCRNCGKSFCHDCSNKTLPLPRFGIEEPVRVCNLCYIQLKRGDAGPAGLGGRSDGLPLDYVNSPLSRESQTASKNNTDELKEQEELELAIAFSLNDQDNKAPKQSTVTAKPTPKPVTKPPQPQPAASTISYGEIPDDDVSDSAGLSKYLDRSYWEQRKKQQEQLPVSNPTSDVGLPPVVAAETPTTRQDTPMLSSIRNTLDMFVKRMHEVNSSGRSIATDISVQSMFQTLTAMHPQLLQQIEALEERKAAQHDVLKKLDDVKEARVSLDAMRRQHQEKLRQQQEEMMMLARMQVQQKRALMQQLKAEEFAFQDQLRQRRQEEMSVQQTMHLQQLQQQKEMESEMRQAYQQQLLEKQFGSMGFEVSSQPPGNPPMSGLSQYNPAGPPMYQESPHTTTTTSQLNSDRSPQLLHTQLQQFQQPPSFQQPPPSGQQQPPPSLQQPPPSLQQPPPSFQQQPPPSLQQLPPSFQQPLPAAQVMAVQHPPALQQPMYGQGSSGAMPQGLTGPFHQTPTMAYDGTQFPVPRTDRTMSQKSVELISFD